MLLARQPLSPYFVDTLALKQGTGGNYVHKGFDIGTGLFFVSPKKEKFAERNFAIFINIQFLNTLLGFSNLVLDKGCTLLDHTKHFIFNTYYNKSLYVFIRAFKMLTFRNVSILVKIKPGKLLSDIRVFLTNYNSPK